MVIGEGGNANEALRKAHAFVPDVFLMDIGLCGESELEVTRRIKRHFLGITVILLTGYDLPEYRDAGFECGATHFIIKDSLI
jgi:DNA-binding NarL/FixJ family response regulator